MIRSIQALILIGLGGLCLIFSSQALSQDENTDQTDSHSHSENQDAPIPLQVQILQSAEEVENRRRIQEENREIERGALAIQQDLAKSARVMKSIALLQTLFVGLGTALVLASLYYLRQANRAAVRAVEVTREIGESQTRAYISVHGNTLPDRLSFRKPEMYSVTVRNDGMTPALNLRMGAILFPKVDEHLPKISDYLEKKKGEASGTSILPSGHDTKCETGGDPPLVDAQEQLGMSTDSPQPVILLVTAIYDDVFGVSCESQSTYVSEPVSEPDENGWYEVRWIAHTDMNHLKMTDQRGRV